MFFTGSLILFHGLTFHCDGRAREFTRRWKTTGSHPSKQKNKSAQSAQSAGPTFSQHFPTQPPLYPTRSHLLWCLPSFLLAHLELGSLLRPCSSCLAPLLLPNKLSNGSKKYCSFATEWIWWIVQGLETIQIFLGHFCTSKFFEEALLLRLDVYIFPFV